MNGTRNKSQNLIRLALYKKTQVVNALFIRNARILPCRLIDCAVLPDFKSVRSNLYIRRVKRICFKRTRRRIRRKKRCKNHHYIKNNQDYYA